MKFRIWSVEHKAWWRPNCRGYTTTPGEAGIYVAEDLPRCRLEGVRPSDEAPRGDLMVVLRDPLPQMEDE